MMRIAIALVILMPLVLAAAVFANVITSSRFFLPSEMNITSLGLNIVSGSFTETREANIILQVSNCTTFQGSTSCMPIAGASVNLTVTKPDNAAEFISSFNDTGGGNYSVRYDFRETGNYSLNFSAMHPAVGANTLLQLFRIEGFMQFNDSFVREFENRTFFGGYNLSYVNFNSTMSKFFNVTITSRETNFTFNLSLYLHEAMPREILALPDDSVFSPSTAKIITKFIDKVNKRNIFRINETNATFAAAQEIAFLLNGTQISLNLSIQNATRDIAYISDHSLIVTPALAEIRNIGFMLNVLNFTANGTGNQEMFLYVGSKGEPANITVDRTTILTGANWTYNSSGKTLRFNFTFSERVFEVNFAPPSEEQPGPAPTAAPPGGGGGGIITIPLAPRNFTAEPAVLRASLLQGSVKTLTLVIRNIAERKDSYKVSTDSRQLITIPEGEFDLEPGEIKRLTVEIFAPESRAPDIYVRKIFVKGLDETKTINVIIEIKPLKPLFDITLEVLPEYKTVEPNSTVLVRIKFTNLGTIKGVRVPYELAALHMESNLTLAQLSGTEFVETQLSTVKALRIPHYAPEGIYLITMRSVIEGQSIVATDIANVKKPVAAAPVFIVPIAGILVWFFVAVIAAFAAVAVYMHILHKRLERKLRERAEGKK